MRKELLKLFFFLCGFRVNRVIGKEKGTILIQIDGLSHEALRYAMKKGYAPSLRKMSSRDYRLAWYYSGLPSSTTATEALLFYGNNFDIPGFTWFDRRLKQFVRGNRSKELAEFEDSYHKKRELLTGGSAIMSVFTGGATELSVSGRNLSFSKSYYFVRTAHYFLISLLYPIQLFRTVYLTIKTLLLYNKSEHHTAKETFSKIALGQFSCYLAEVEIMRNTKNIFVDFLLYDEFAHEYGPTHTTTLSTLRLIDRYVKRIITTTRTVDRRYDIVVFSDHGQTESIPWDVKDEISTSSIGDALNDPHYRVIKTYGGFVPQEKSGELYVVPAGSTLQLYFSDYLSNGTTESELNGRFPGFIHRLLSHPEFGWALVKCGGASAKLYGKSGSILFKSGKSLSIEGDPFPHLGLEEKNAVIRSFSYYSQFPNNGDVVLFGNITQDHRVISFENHQGTHGGFYGPMTHPFILTDGDDLDMSSMESMFSSLSRGMR